MLTPTTTHRTAANPGGTADDGFTLIELTISVGILGLIMTGLVGLFAVTVANNGDTDTRLRQSLDLQFASSFFADDVAGAQTFATGSTPGCGTDPAGADVLELRGQTFDTSVPPVMQTTITSYVLRNATLNGQPVRQLHRLTCTGPSPTPSLPLTPTRDTTVASMLSASTTPTVTCANDSDTTVACSTTGSGGAVSVTLQLTTRGDARTGTLTGTLTARRRTS